MVDFSALMDESEEAIDIDPREIFESLPKSQEISNLYDTQAQILKKWYEELRDEKDVVIELNTGGGKTLVGLLIALSSMRETGEGVLYLVDNKQLVGQVVDQASQLGIPAKAYAGRESLDASFYNGESVIVGTYQALFNGKSIFGVLGDGKAPMSLGGIVVDDAHASLGALNQAFTLEIPFEGNRSTYKSILSEFREAFDAIDLSTTYNELLDGVGNAIVEIPYEYWMAVQSRVSRKLSEEWAKRKDERTPFGSSLLFNWPLIKNNLKYCQVIVSGKVISIAALFPLLHMIPSFNSAKRRIFMSATITDYGDMVRAYDLRQLTKDHVITLKTSSGVGRRMVLAVSKNLLDSEEFKSLIEHEVESRHGVVRLAPRSGMEFPWFATCEVTGHEGVETIVKSLRDRAVASPVSFINRYNGIDLPDDACRILFIHGLPSSCDDVDALMSMYLSTSDISAQRVAQRIEQGVGRGVRGASDHCVVLLIGSDLQEWVKRKSNRRYFSPAFRAQIEMGERICSDVTTPQDICETMLQDLDSDEGWKRFHAATLAKQDSRNLEDCFGLSFEGACLERQVFAKWLEHGNERACSKVMKDLVKFDNDELYQGWLLSIAARIAFEGGNAQAASQLLSQAHSLNRSIKNVRAPHFGDDLPAFEERAGRVASYIAHDEGALSLMQCFDGEIAALDFSSRHNDFEESLKKLGCYLGFESERADDNGTGPDVYWVSQKEGIGFALEAKNEKETETPLHKEEAGQLRTAIDWLKQQKPNIEVLGVSVHPNNIADANASAENLWVLTPDSLKQLIDVARSALDEIIAYPEAERAGRIASVLNRRGLGAQELARVHLAHFEAGEKKLTLRDECDDD